MEPLQLKCAEALARHEHYERAAKELGIPAPELSLQVAKLEAELGVRLLARKGTALQLTKAGQELLAFTKKIGRDERKLLAKMEQYANEADAPLRIGILSCMQSLGFAHELASFREQYPKTGFDLYEASNTELIAMAEEGPLDLAIVINPPQKEGLLAQKLYDDELILVTALGHPLASRKEVTLQDFENETLVISESDTMYADFCAVLEKDAPDVHIDFFLTHGTSLLNNIGLVASGLGIAVLTKNVTEGFSYFDFAKIKIVPKIPRNFSIISTPQAAAKKNVGRFVEYLKKQYAGQ